MIAMLIVTSTILELTSFADGVSFHQGDQIKLIRQEPLLFLNQLFRTGRDGELLTVIAHLPGERNIFVQAKDKDGKDIALSVAVDAVSSVAAGKVLYTLDFAGKQMLKAGDWLKDNNFKLQKDFTDSRYITYSFDQSSMVIESKREAFGFAVQEIPLTQAKKIRITWGVNKYPVGASWENGVNREGLMVYIFYGKETVDSGAFFLPNSPYYVGLYFSNTDPKDKVYIGKSYKTCARYVCVGNPKPGETVVTEYDIDNAFRNLFQKDKTPPVSAISLEVDTAGTSDGLSKSFVSRIELLE